MGPHFKTLSKQSSGKYIKSEFLLFLFRHWYSAENDNKWLSFKNLACNETLLTKSKQTPFQYDVKQTWFHRLFLTKLIHFFLEFIAALCFDFRNIGVSVYLFIFQWISFCVCICVENMFTHYSNCGLMNKRMRRSLVPAPLSHPWNKQS